MVAMSDLPKTYDPSSTEPKWRKFWNDTKIFQDSAQNSVKESFCMVMPPPNVTGRLHMGHALVNTLQDILLRFEKMCGKRTLWIPGLDHAGIATQTVVERTLIHKEGLKRQDIGRQAFIEKVWQWKKDHSDVITDQIKRLGCGCDFSKTKFTLDTSCSKAVRKVFKQMFDAGLIYQGDYLVNWDPITQTALADDEVEYEEKSSFLWHIRYPLENETSGQTHVIVATTRPETMLGDAAVVVHPKDDRYKDLVGKKIRLPITNRLIPIIADTMADPEFGSGAVKITPAHDPNDYELGLKLSLPMINIMTPDALINEIGGADFQGLSMKAAREKIVETLKSLDLLEKIEPHTHRVGISYRSKATIEPYLSKQWFVDTKPFKERLLRLVESDEVELIPSSWKKTYFHWIKNLRPWCISRQLWWGHQIPVWKRKDDPSVMICYDKEGKPPEVRDAPEAWEEDPDVLDTWFSSALWPFSALGWPENPELVHTFYPNSTLITGHDILFFWVARMIMMGDYVMEKPPFPKVFLHGLIYGKSYWRKAKDGAIAYVSSEEQRAFDLGEPIPKDVLSKWEKMSKSKGNVIDPIEVIDEYGCDAMRMALSSFPVQNRQIDLDRRRFEEFKNFSNKIWNGARFAWMNLEDLSLADLTLGIDIALLEVEDKWILHSARLSSKKIHSALENYHFDTATTQAYEFFWNEFCANFLEVIKPTLFGKRGDPALRKNKQKVLLAVLIQSLAMLHPFAPFITEELFHGLKEKFVIDEKAYNVAQANISDTPTLYALSALTKNSIVEASFPLDASSLFDEAYANFHYIEKVVSAVRNIRGEMKLTPKSPIDLHIVAKSKNDFLEKSAYILKNLCSIEAIHFHKKAPTSPHLSQAHVDDTALFVPMPADIIERESVRLTKEKERLEKELLGANARLNDKSFLEKAPMHIQENIKKRKEQIEVLLQQISKSL